MIYNNYRAMEFVREVGTDALSPELLLELHRIVTDGTLENAEAEGRFRGTSDIVSVVDARDNTVLHTPPPGEQLEERIATLCSFANEDSAQGEFLHPVVRSILLHFMIGYDHPFLDGNGRTARALFYWSMAKHGYWLMEFVSVSTIIRRGPARYARAYLYTETDDNDTTYFIDYHLNVIVRAISALHDYLNGKSEELREVTDLLGTSQLSRILNHRQIALLTHALKNPETAYSFKGHQNSHRVTYQTARTDLLKLVDIGFLKQEPLGRGYMFLAVQDLRRRLMDLTG